MSAAVSGLPLGNVIPFRTLSVHTVLVLFDVHDSAKTGSTALVFWTIAPASDLTP